MKKNRSTNVYKRLINLSIGSGISVLLMMSSSSFAATLKHVVNPGETLSQLAVRYKVSQTQIIDVNGLEATHLKIGQVLNIPDVSKPDVYTVQSGDSLYSVAQKYNITTTELARINNIPTNARLDIADTLILPSNATLTPSKQGVATVETSSSVATRTNTTRTVSQVQSNTKNKVAGKHRVMRGETLTKIANDYGVSLSNLAQANNIGINSIIKFGQWLVIPSANTATARASDAATPAAKTTAPTSYTVQPGDGLIVIARKFNIDFMDLAKENGLEGYETLRVGQVLKLPANAVANN